jgi:hypothetical protein
MYPGMSCLDLHNLLYQMAALVLSSLSLIFLQVFINFACLSSLSLVFLQVFINFACWGSMIFL